MAGHVLDHFFFAGPRSEFTKRLWFALWAGSVIISFWWFKDLALGVHGPVNAHGGWLWRTTWNVSDVNVDPTDMVDIQLTTFIA